MQLNVTVAPDLRARLHEAAEGRGLTVTGWLRDLVAGAVAVQPADPAETQTPAPSADGPARPDATDARITSTRAIAGVGNGNGPDSLGARAAA